MRVILKKEFGCILFSENMIVNTKIEIDSLI